MNQFILLISSSVNVNFLPFFVSHRLESFGSDNALYEYTVENVSLPQPLEEKQKENELLQQVNIELNVAVVYIS